jgi:hypothetical protein
MDQARRAEMLTNTAQMYYFDDDKEVVQITDEPSEEIANTLWEETDIFDMLSKEQQDNLVKVIHKLCIIHHLTEQYIAKELADRYEEENK